VKRLDHAITTGALAILVIAGVETGVKSAVQQKPIRQTISVNGYRPLLEVVKALEQRYHVAITYEDPPYLDPSELVDITDRVGAHPPNGVRLYVPRGGPFSFEYSVRPGAGSDQLEDVLTALLRSYRSTPYPHSFRLLKTDGIYNIVPVGRRNKSGREEAYEAILSSEVPFVRGGEPRSAYEALVYLAKAVQRSRGVEVLAEGPPNILSRSKVSDPPAYGVARSELLRILRSTGQRLTYQLLYNPVLDGSFAIEVTTVPE
jgi:hypothetical protein